MLLINNLMREREREREKDGWTQTDGQTVGEMLK